MVSTNPHDQYFTKHEACELFVRRADWNKLINDLGVLKDQTLHISHSDEKRQKDILHSVDLKMFGAVNEVRDRMDVRFNAQDGKIDSVRNWCIGILITQGIGFFTILSMFGGK